MKKLIEGAGEEYAIISYWHKAVDGVEIRNHPVNVELRKLAELRTGSVDEENARIERFDYLRNVHYIPVKLMVTDVKIVIPGGFVDGGLSVKPGLISAIVQGIADLEMGAKKILLSESEAAD